MTSGSAARGRGPLEPSHDDPRAPLAERLRHLRDGVPSVLYLLAWAGVFVAVGVGVGYLLDRVLLDDALGRADVNLARWFARRRTDELNDVTEWATWAAHTESITLLALVTFVWARLAWKRWREPALVAAAVGGEVLIFLAITFLVDRDRPPVPPLDQAPPTSSFPSGHTAASIAMYGALAVLASQRARSALVRGLTLGLAFLVPVMVGLCRMYRGMHFVTDVIGGALLGTAWLSVALQGVRLGVLHHELRAGAARSARGRFRRRTAARP